jgi:hypothetical protein
MKVLLVYPECPDTFWSFKHALKFVRKKAALPLLGRQPRTKSAAQIIAELDSLYATGWRGNVFFVDDNFISNKKILKTKVLPALIEWQRSIS